MNRKTVLLVFWVAAFAIPTMLTVVGCMPRPPKGAETVKYAYGEKVTFTREREITFPDFRLRYVGQTRVTSPVYPRGFVYENFIITAASGEQREQKVLWSSGTGDIAPAAFTVAGKRYLLELKVSDLAGRLKNDELIVRLDGMERGRNE